MHHFHCYSFVANEIVNLNRARFERIEEEEEESRKTVEFVAVVIDFRHDSIIYFFYPSFLFFFALFRIVTDRKIIAYRLSERSGQREGGGGRLFGYRVRAVVSPNLSTDSVCQNCQTFFHLSRYFLSRHQSSQIGRGNVKVETISNERAKVGTDISLSRSLNKLVTLCP